MNCKLCSKDSLELFGSVLILEKYNEKLFQCKTCGFISFANAHWLDEAYQDTITINDIGLTRRVLTNYAFLVNFTRFLNLSTTVFDFGANNGLLAYLLNARGIRAKSYDRFESSIIGPVGSLSELHEIGILCAFEVLEHLSDPSGDIEILFNQNIPFIIVSTELYNSHTDFDNWWYLQKDTGQHISFYSKKSLEFIAIKYGYEYYHVYGRHIFSKYHISKRLLLKIGIAQKLRYRQFKDIF